MGELVGRLRSPEGVAVAAIAALPTLVAATMRPELVSDDWWVAAAVRFDDWSVLEPVLRSRPLQGLWFGATYSLLGTGAVPHLLVLAVLNGLVGALIWVCARQHLPRRQAILTALAWAVLANRGSTRLWIVTAPEVLALVPVLAAHLQTVTGALVGRRRLQLVALIASALLLYEGAAFLALAVALHAGLSGADRGRRARTALVTLAPLVPMLAWTFVQSPKSGNVHPFRHVDRLLSIHFGAGVLPDQLAGLGILAIVLVAFAASTFVLPSFRPAAEERMVLAGVALLALGAGPFVAIGFPQTTDGIFDRGNFYADLGTALVIAGAVSYLWRIPLPLVRLPLAGLAMSILFAQNTTDVAAFTRAARDGRRLFRAADALPADVLRNGPVVLAPFPVHHGVAVFVVDSDVSAALALRYDTGRPYPDVRIAENEGELVGAERGTAYRLEDDRLVPLPG